MYRYWLCVTLTDRLSMYARDIDGLLWSSWVKIEEEHFWQEINGCTAAIKFPPLCTSHYYF